jgi:hypothetical protein
MGSLFTRGNAPRLHIHRTGLFRPTIALPTPPVGVPASPWVLAKARSKLGASIRLCGDGRCQKRRQWGHCLRENAPRLHIHGTGLFRPTTALPTPPVGVSASPWVLAKARNKLGALIRLCGDGRCQIRRQWGHFLRENAPRLHIHRTGLFRPTTPPVGVSASPWVLAKARSQLEASIRLCGDGRCQKRRQWGHCLHGGMHPACTYIEPGCSDPPPHSRRPPLAFPPRPGCWRRPEAS